MSDLGTATLAEQIAEVARECAMREGVYGKWVASGRMTVEESRRRIRRMRAALATLGRLQAEQETTQPMLAL